MSIDKDYLKQVWNSVWKDGLSEFQVQKRYYDILNNELKGTDRSYLIEVRSRLNELEENEIEQNKEVELIDFIKTRLNEKN